jgi:F-type H+-transporting ATPase subunit delta
MTTELQELIHRAQPDVSERRLARVYAESLLNAAEQNNVADQMLSELHELTTYIAGREPFVQAFFLSGVIGKERRETALKAAFEGRCHPLLMNFLLVLNDHDRLMLFRIIDQEIRHLADLRRRHFRVLVQSAVPLAEDQKQRLENDFRKAFRLEPILEQKIEPNLLGGMIIRVGDWVFDGSVRTQLVNLRKQMREMSSHEIQSRRDRFGAGG